MHCTYCGKEIQEDEECLCRQTAATKKPNPPKIVVKIAAAIGVLIIAIICFFSVLSNTKIDPFEYVEVTYSGFNTSGEAEVDLDIDALICRSIGKEMDISDIDGLKEYITYTNNIAISCSKTEGLSNGDIITVTITISGSARNKVKSGEKNYVVSGLTGLTPLDPLSSENISLTFSGFSGCGEAEFSACKPEGTNRYLSYQISKENGLRNGDTVTVTFTADVEEMALLGYHMQETGEKTFTVAGLLEYYELSGSFPQELLSAHKAAAQKMVMASIEDLSPGATLSANPEYIRSYYLQAKNLSEPYNDPFRGVEFVNAVGVVEKYIVDFGMSFYRTYWYVYLFQDHYYDSTGKLLYNTDKEQYFLFIDDSFEQFETTFANECNMMNITTIG